MTLTISSGKTASLAIRPPQGMPSRRDQHVAMLKPPEKVDQPTGPCQRCSASCHDEVAVIDFFGVGFAVFGVVFWCSLGSNPSKKPFADNRIRLFGVKCHSGAQQKRDIARIIRH